jgi:Dynamin family
MVSSPQEPAAADTPPGPDTPSGRDTAVGPLELAGATLEADTEHYLAQVRRILRDCQASDDALRLLDEAAGQPDQSAVVVVGERGTGKSSLVNALLGEPGLLPVQPGAATGAYCVVRYGPSFRVLVHLPGGQTLVAPEGSGREWLQQYGRADAEVVPAWIEVELPDSRLEGLQLVDTPGVGGLDSAFGELTMQSLRLAEALVFVSACSAPLGRAELEFLRRASAQVDRVIFVLTRVDGPAGWRKVAAENQTLLAESAPRFATASTLPVSSKWARDSGRASRPDLAERLLTDSGIPALWREVQGLTGKRAALRLANRVRAARSALELAHQERYRAWSLLGDVPAAKSDVRARQARLEDWNRRSEEWYDDLDIMFRRLHRNVTNYLNGCSEALLDHFDPDHEPAERKLIADLGDLQHKVAQLLSARMTEIAAEIGNGITLEVDLHGRLQDMIGSGLEEPVKPPPRNDSRRSGEGMMQTQSAYMGTMMAHTAIGIVGTAGLAVLGTATPVGWVLAGGFGAFWLYKANKARQQTSAAAARRAWAVQYVNKVVRGLDQECEARIEEAAHLIISTMRRACPQEMVRLQRELEECQRAEAQSQDERTAALQKIEEHCRNLAGYAKRADERLEALTTGLRSF